MATAIQAPSVLAMIVCDGAHRDPATGKFTILGTFNIIGCKQFPVTHGMMVFFIVLTDGMGKTQLKMDLVSADESITIFSKNFTIDFPDPLVVAELPLAVQNVEFPTQGEYRLRLFCGDTPMMERRIMVAIVQQAGIGPNEPDADNQ